MATRNFDWNTWAKGQNRAPGTHAEYMLKEDLPGGGYKTVRDPFYSTPEYINKTSAKPTEKGATMWSSNNPTAGWYSPTGMDWQQLTNRR